MVWLMQTLITAVVAFAATNLDDIVMLMLLFSQVPARFSPRQIVLGQYLGLAVLVGLSLPGFFGGLVLPKPWLGLLGIVPIAIGCNLWLGKASEAAVPGIKPVSLPGLSPPLATVAALTVANGGDNIGVYVSLFAGQTWGTLGLTLLTFAGLVGVWCYTAYALVQHPAVGDRLTQYGHYLVPPVLMGLGLFILIENKTYQLLNG